MKCPLYPGVSRGGRGYNRGVKVDSAIVTLLVGGLCEWYRHHARDLPWRRARNPYAIWISEIMLQQTQVKTVIPYYERWMQQFPDVRRLAAAEPEQVLKAWEGLGYYSRARNLHRAARIIVTEHRGRFPDDFQAVLELPGIGRYTAGAICSIAFDHPTPILDGNVMRVLTRVFGIRGDPRAKSVNARLWALAENLVRQAARVESGNRPGCGQLNQALMELGAMICTPSHPRCADCPGQGNCVAKRRGWVDRLPEVRPRIATTTRRFTAFVLRYRGRFWIRQRPANGVNAGLWEFPNVEVTNGKDAVEDLAGKLFGMRPATMTRLGVIRHSITRYRITVEVYRLELPDSARGAKQFGGEGAPGVYRWSSRAELEQLAFTAAHRQIVRLCHQPTARPPEPRPGP